MLEVAVDDSGSNSRGSGDSGDSGDSGVIRRESFLSIPEATRLSSILEDGIRSSEDKGYETDIDSGSITPDPE
jgi:hypothetical protein